MHVAFTATAVAAAAAVQADTCEARVSRAAIPVAARAVHSWRRKPHLVYASTAVLRDLFTANRMDFAVEKGSVGCDVSTACRTQAGN